MQTKIPNFGVWVDIELNGGISGMELNPMLVLTP